MKVLTFFYGSYINREVLAEVDLVPDRVEVASLSGFDIRIAPLANLVRSPGHSVYGILTGATHEELERLYAHARDVLGGVYRPEAVLAHTADGRFVPALCYIARSMEPAAAADDYVDRIVGPARELGFPDWYVRRLESSGSHQAWYVGAEHVSVGELKTYLWYIRLRIWWLDGGSD